MPDPATPNLNRIATGDLLEGGNEIWRAMCEILPEAEKWVGHDIVLECDERGWMIRYTHGNNYRDRLSDRYAYRFVCAEDAIQVLANLIAEKKAEAEREDAING